MKKCSGIFLVLVLLLGLVSSQQVFGESNFPTKPVNLYVGFSAGGSTDTLARGLAKGAEEFLGKKVLVVNKPGGGGTVAATLVAKSKPDGYAVQINPDTPLTRAPHLRDLEFDPMKDLSFIARVGVWKNGFVVPENSPFETWEDVVTWAKEHPGELKYGAPGTGTSPDIAMALIAHREGFTYRSIPFKGDTPNMAALLGGHTMIAGSSSGAWGKYVKSNKMRVLLIFEKEGVEGFQAPTFKDIGYEIETPTSVIIFGPDGIPMNIREKLGKAFVQGAQTEEFKNIAKSMDLMETDNILTGNELDEYVKRSYELYKSYIEEAGLALKK